MKLNSYVLTPLMIGLLALSSAAQALEAGDWIIRGGATYVDPNDDSDEIEALGVPVPGTGVDVDSDTSFGFTIGYMMTDNWGIELLAATPFKHNIGPNDVTAALLGSSSSIGSTKHLPPTLSVNYHFQPKASWRPYVGLGVNYTYFFSEDTSGAVEAAGYSDLELDSSWGLAAQAGIDIDLTKNIFLNLNARYIDIDTDAKITGFGLPTLTVDNVEIDPWVFSIGIGTTF
jgi:outer membrane protein